MYFSKSTFLTVFAACCVSITMAQLDKYDELSEDDLKAQCEKNGIDVNKLADAHAPVWALLLQNLNANITSEEVFKTDGNCMGPNLQVLLQPGIEIARSCVKGQISLTDDDAKTLNKRSARKLCALARLSSYEMSLSDCIDAANQEKCESSVRAGEVLPNDEEYSNLGLTYSPQGKKVWNNMLDCSSKSITKCDAKQQKTHLKLTERMKETMKTRK